LKPDEISSNMPEQMKLPDEAKRLEQQAQLIEKFLRELTEQYGEIPAVIVIGGFAVRAHGATRFSHDGDIMVDMGTYAALRDQYTVYKAERLGKSEFRTPSNIEIDVYVENQHKLRVPFDEAQAYAVKKKGLWVACVEHLLILKLDALKDRGNTDKGEKDIDDILLLLSRNEIAHPDLLKRHLRSGDWSILDEVIDTAGNWQRFTNQNYKESATLQERVIAALKAIKPTTPDFE
jgi:hypothetical protein